MSGIAVKRGDLRAKLLQERDERIVEFMRAGRPIRAIAELEALNWEQCRKMCDKLAKQHGVEYTPRSEGDTPAMPEGLTSESSLLRSRLGDLVYHLSFRQKRHPLEISKLVGLGSQRAQKLAQERPFAHDWKLSQIERLAKVHEMPFKHLMLQSLLSAEEYAKVRSCLKP